MVVTRPAAARRTPGRFNDTTAVAASADQDDALQVTQQDGDFADELPVQM